MLSPLCRSSRRRNQGGFEPPRRDLYKVLAIDLPRARRLAFGVVLGQALVSMTAALCAWAVADRRAALSALLGGGIATLGSLVMAGIGLGNATGSNPQRALVRFFVAEAVKVALVIAMFVVALKTVKLTPLAMFAAFAATFLVYWIALLSALPRVSGQGRSA
jgi:ATP synthase protein I